MFESQVCNLKDCNFIKKRLQPRCFLVNIAKFLRTAILKNISERLPLIFNKNFNQILHEQKHLTFNNAVTINLTLKILSQPSQTQKPPKISYTKTTEEYWCSIFSILFFFNVFYKSRLLVKATVFWDFLNFCYCRIWHEVCHLLFLWLSHAWL